ncbi:MAG TPA: UDP-2,3-diacylglucosamine diphosphatase [Gammaproteobacteria bacterium]|nr:UDP-2,3-diacylglucosamine diphosphatase [Gammaproteobacteria bacterium]
MHTLFISDLHLSAERPQKLALFQRLLRERARNADSLYILGDLFEAWAGDDDDTPPHPDIIGELADYTAAGGKLFIMRGNRDYLLGPAFIEACGARSISDPTRIDLYGVTTLLMHGDTLCSRDTRYQIFRRLVNNPPMIKLFLCIPWRLREKIWHGIRRAARKTTSRKPPNIVDVYQPTVEKTLHEQDVLTLIHGHTHKQGVHEFKLDGRTARRYVLGDWYVEDSVLVANAESMRLMRVEEYLDGD